MGGQCQARAGQARGGGGARAVAGEENTPSASSQGACFSTQTPGTFSSSRVSRQSGWGAACAAFAGMEGGRGLRWTQSRLPPAVLNCPNPQLPLRDNPKSHPRPGRSPSLQPLSHTLNPPQAETAPIRWCPPCTAGQGTVLAEFVHALQFL